MTFHIPETDAVEAARRHLRLRSRRYVVFLGTIEPRKNVPALIEGWRRVVSGLTDPPALVVAGGRGWDTRIDTVLASMPDHLEVLLPGYLPSSCSPASWAERRSSRTRAWRRASGFRYSRRWRVAPPCSPRVRWPCPRWVRMQWPIRNRRQRASPRHSAACWRIPLVVATWAAATARASAFTWTACAERHLRTYARAAAA